MYRFFESNAALHDGTIALSKENSHHMISVLRMNENEEFEIVIDQHVYLCRLENLDKSEAIALIIEDYEDKNEADIKINLYQGIPKSDKLELIIQKAVELGVTKIIPFESSRTVVKWDAKKEAKKLKRYEEIAHSAAKQAKRAFVPAIEKSISFKEILASLENKFVLLAYENRGTSLKSILQDKKDKVEDKEINIIIGPEGGFSEEEVKVFEEIGAHIVHLGNRILRTETAAIAMLAMVQYEVGDVNEEI